MSSKKYIKHGKYVKIFFIGKKEATAIWDTRLKRGRLIWVDGKAHDLFLPRDRKYAETIITEGERFPNVSQSELNAIDCKKEAI